MNINRDALSPDASDTLSHILSRLDALEHKTDNIDIPALKTEIAQLQKLVVMTESEVRGLRLVVQSIMACHPEPSRLKEFFQSIVSAYASGMKDSGFENDIAPEHVRLFLEKTEEVARRWEETFWPPKAQ